MRRFLPHSSLRDQELDHLLIARDCVQQVTSLRPNNTLLDAFEAFVRSTAAPNDASIRVRSGSAKIRPSTSLGGIPMPPAALSAPIAVPISDSRFFVAFSEVGVCIKRAHMPSKWFE